VRRAPSIRLHWEQRRQLLALARSEATPARVALRVAIALRASEGATNLQVAAELGTSPATTALWRRRFLAHGVAGLVRDAPRPGRPASIPGAKVRAVVRAASDGRPPTGRVPTARGLAQELGVSKSTVQRIWSEHGVHPRRQRPRPPADRGMGFLDVVTDLVGLYVNPPGRAVAFSTDERVRPRSPSPGALPFVPPARPRDQAAEFRAFLQMMDRETPRVLDVHMLIDSRLYPVPAEVEQWLDRHPRFHLHPLPADRAGLTLMDRLIDGFSRRKDRPGASASAHRLKYALRDHLRRNRDPLATFVWTATSGEIRGAYDRTGIP